MIIGIDMDDSIFDFIPSVLKKYNEAYNDNVQYEDITDYGIAKFLKPECKNIFQEFANDELFLNLEPKENAVEVITDLNKQHDVYFISAGHPYTAKARDQILQKTFDWYKSKQLILCPPKKLMKVDLLIDDCIDNVISGEYESILFTEPWNKEFDAKSWDILKADGWNDVPEFVDIYYDSYLYRKGY
jgi:5'(3')-deoxyribonucleotidase